MLTQIRAQCIGNIISTAVAIPAGTTAIHRRTFMVKSVGHLESNVNAHAITLLETSEQPLIRQISRSERSFFEVI